MKSLEVVREHLLALLNLSSEPTNLWSLVPVRFPSAGGERPEHTPASHSDQVGKLFLCFSPLQGRAQTVKSWAKRRGSSKSGRWVYYLFALSALSTSGGEVEPKSCREKGRNHRKEGRKHACASRDRGQPVCSETHLSRS